jgi:hypothetical protein
LCPKIDRITGIQLFRNAYIKKVPLWKLRHEDFLSRLKDRKLYKAYF